MSIDEYIAEFPDEVQTILNKIRETIRLVAPEATEAIKYKIPTFVLHENLVHFAGYKNHVGFYPSPSAIEHFSEELKPYKSAKGSVQFPLDSPIPYDLIERMVAFRVAEVDAKKDRKRQAKD